MTDFQKERYEAIDAGYRALTSLNAALQQLKSARTWGNVDMFLSSGLFTSMMKYSKINKAQRYMDEARYALESFSRELQDVNRYYNLSLEIGDFLTFADVCMDNFFVDWAVQTRIKQAAEQVEQAIAYITEILHQLEETTI